MPQILTRETKDSLNNPAGLLLTILLYEQVISLHGKLLLLYRFLSWNENP